MKITVIFIVINRAVGIIKVYRLCRIKCCGSVDGSGRYILILILRAYIDEYYPENTLSGAAVHKAINYTYPDGTIGYYNTDWQKEIYRIGLSTDQNIGISGGGDKYPFRISLGYTDQNGTLKGSTFSALLPPFFVVMIMTPLEALEP